MNARLIDIRTSDDPRDEVHRAVQALVEGKLIAIPTETVYVLAANALDRGAVDRLVKLTGPGPGRITLAVRSASSAADLVPNLGLIGERLARRCWPGPLTLVCPDDHADGLVRRLPMEVQSAVAANGKIALRVLAHEVALDILRLMPGPLAITSAGRATDAVSCTVDQVAADFHQDLELILDDGKSRFGQPASVVELNGRQLRLVRSGVINRQALQRLAGFLMLFVCTGNTCRSPMAAALMRRRLAQRLGCPASQLDELGVMVMSAGVSATLGASASPESVQTLSERGVDLTDHESQPLTERLARFADVMLTMTRGHRETIVSQVPEAVGRVRLLCRDGADVSDPIGGPLDLYRRCADQIDCQLEGWMKEFEEAIRPVEIKCGDQP